MDRPEKEGLCQVRLLFPRLECLLELKEPRLAWPPVELCAKDRCPPVVVRLSEKEEPPLFGPGPVRCIWKELARKGCCCLVEWAGNVLAKLCLSSCLSMPESKVLTIIS